MNGTVRLPAEWEEQDAVLLGWAHLETDWWHEFDVVKPCFGEIAAAVAKYEEVILVLPDPDTALSSTNLTDEDLDNIESIKVPTNDTWARDYGPITVETTDGMIPLDFGFNGWGLKFPANLDNRINQQIESQKYFKNPLCTKFKSFILEGGSIESDGEGTLLTTSNCLLSPNRNPCMGRDEITGFLKSCLGVKQIHWLDHGALVGDDTDSHIDTLARFAPGGRILYVAPPKESSDPHHADLSLMEKQLSTFKTLDGRPYELIPLPFPDIQKDFDGNRLPATYANFLVVNGAVIAPTYGSKRKDAEALDTLAQAFPGRKVVGVDCRPLILQHGSLHCLTMQLPKGTMNSKVYHTVTPDTP